MKCSSCLYEKPIINKKFCLCDDCNYKRLHKGRSKQEVYYEKSLKKGSKSSQTKKKSYIYHPKSTGERDLFLEIWSEREHICVKCKKPLGEVPNVFFFSHIKSKGAYPELRLVKSNIELVCIECHQKYEFEGRES